MLCLNPLLFNTFFNCIIEWRSAHVHRLHAFCRDQPTMAQRADTTVAEYFCRVARELVSPICFQLCMDKGIGNPLRPCWVKGVCTFWCNPPPAYLAERQGSFTCHRGNGTGMERTPNKSQHRKLTLEKIRSPIALAGIRPHNLSIMSPVALYQQAIPVIIIIIMLQ